MSFETVDCPVKFTGVISMKAKGGKWFSVPFTFGYGDIPTMESVRESLEIALKQAQEQTGMKLEFPTPAEFLSNAATEMYGVLVSAGCAIEQYEVFKKARAK